MGNKRYLVLVILAVAVSGCWRGAIPVQPLEAPAPGPAPTEVLPTATPVPDILPNPVYFLSAASGSSQVWRLARDGVTLDRLTDEPAPVDRFAVSPVDGSVAYLTANQLYLVQPDVSGRALLVDGGPADDAAPNETRILSLAWSPDGRTLAYGHNGINLYSFEDGVSQVVLPNIIRDADGNLTMGFKIFQVVGWSPDSSKLLLTLSAWETFTYTIWDVATQALIPLVSESLVCCNLSWSPDGGTLWAASSISGMVTTGLWRYDATTGVETVLMARPVIDGLRLAADYAAYPMQMGDALYYLWAPMGDTLSYPVPYLLVRAPVSNVNERTTLHSDAWPVSELLWAADGSLGLGILPEGPRPEEGYAFGALVLIPTDGSPGITLVESAAALAWGP
ncbi:MAG: hypothetical protein EPO32_10920 [Anaerolineae bacterium]|nr:MAG: hypothetical protein EPO32_10920 [Anaerolineae bacterium]